MSEPEYDPFAEAQVSGSTASAPAAGASGGSGSGSAVADPFTGTADMDDPFATSDDYRGGPFIPSPPLESLKGRLVAMFPRAFDPEAKDPNNPGETREQYTVDLYVLDGGDLNYFYTQRGNPDAKDEAGRQDQVLEWKAEGITPETPFHVGSYWVPQGGVIGKLKRAHRDGVPFLGIPAYAPQKVDRDKKTSAQVQAEVEAWIARGRQGTRPRYGWAMEAPDPERKQGAIRFWAKHKAEIDPINRASAPADRRA